MRRKRCPVCGKLFLSLASHFSALTWDRKGKGRTLRKDSFAKKHRDYYYKVGIKK